MKLPFLLNPTSRRTVEYDSTAEAIIFVVIFLGVCCFVLFSLGREEKEGKTQKGSQLGLFFLVFSRERGERGNRSFPFSPTWRMAVS